MPEKTLAEFAATFDRASLQPRLAEAEQQRRMIEDKFPREGLRTLEMARYADDREDRSTLAWLLAKGTPALGDISSVAFNAIGIHRLKGSGLYRSTLTDVGDAAKDWKNLREGLAQCCDLVQSRQWEAIDRVAYASHVAALRSKLLFVYFPDEVLPIYALAEMKHLLEALGATKGAGEGKSSAVHNRKLLERLRAISEISGWTTLEFTELLRAWFPKSERKPSDMVQPELVLRAMQNLRDDDPDGHECVTSDQVRRYVQMNFGKDIAACGTVMADMVAPGLTQTKTSKIPLSLRVLERVRPGFYRILSDVEAATDLTDSDGPKSKTESPMSAQALNQILYGPPGTGKTYQVIRKAAAIVAGQALSDDQEAKAAYDRASADGRVRLATFHQSFSYEDFIEGIRPVMGEGGEARFQVRDGVFKEMATEALFKCLERTTLSPNLSDFDARWTSLCQMIEETGELKIPGLASSEFLLRLNRMGGIDAERVGSKTVENCSRSVLAIVWEKLSNRDQINSSESRKAYGKNNQHHIIAAVFNFMKKNVKPLSVRDSMNQQISEADKFTACETYLELGPDSGWQLRADKNYPPYVLIIDEINRGNISRIFGELITLIEEDKREGGANALRVTLPSSRESFTVPPNLFLLGTMNTADKSLALLDVALRRRFDFRELAPDFSVCGLPPDMRSVLERINERIELRKDRDHRIGHAFFMGIRDVADFNRVFARKVVPLLQEYFFNDIDGARFVLGEIGREGEAGFLRQITAAPSEAKYQRNRWRWFTDEEPDMDCWARLRDTLGGEIP